jgi:hypothetical protein
MGIAVFQIASFLMFSVRFLWLFKINFVTKSNKIKIFEKLYMNHFLAWNNIKREKYLKDSLFFKFFVILCNKPSRWIQKFAVGVTKLMPPDEIRRFDGNFFNNICVGLSETVLSLMISVPYNPHLWSTWAGRVQLFKPEITLPLRSTWSGRGFNLLRQK